VEKFGENVDNSVECVENPGKSFEMMWKNPAIFHREYKKYSIFA
jgi:hypothetical protein